MDATFAVREPHPGAIAPALPRAVRKPLYLQRFAVEQQETRAHADMLEGYGRTGGVWSGDQVAEHLRASHAQPVSTLARWVVEREILSFEWRGQILIPMFQFEAATFTPRPGVRAVMRELSEAFDDWEMANWFAQPNDWLHGAVPADELQRDARAVFHAARADRFVALG